MSPNRRILLNIVASYGRSLFSIACGLFSTRWVLMALGQTDLGLYSVVGGLTMLIAFLNIQFASAVCRYFAYSIGRKNQLGDSDGVDECVRWFNVAVFVHSVLPLVLTLIGYPIGIHAITHGWLEIPMGRIEACKWVWRFTCIGCLVGMMDVPFQGMFTAKQYIAELTVYNFAQTAAKTCLAYLMVINPCDWLSRYAFAMMCISVVPALLIGFRAMRVFPECKINVAYMFDKIRIFKLISYVVWQVVGSIGYVLRNTGVSVLVNKLLGPKVNAAMSIGGMLSSETAVLTGALNNAFSPVISTACGAGDFVKMQKMSFRSCKFGLLLTLIFALPLALEVDEVLRLWLKTPPLFASEFCLCLLACVVLDKATLGHVMAINASGRLAKFQSAHGFSLMTALPVAGLFYYFIPGIWSIGIALVVTMIFSILCDVWVARRIVNMSSMVWVKEIMIPIIILVAICLCFGVVPSFFMEPSFTRVMVTTVVTVAFFIPSTWFLVLSVEERLYLRKCIMSKLGRWG